MDIDSVLDPDEIIEFVRAFCTACDASRMNGTILIEISENKIRCAPRALLQGTTHIHAVISRGHGCPLPPFEAIRESWTGLR